MTVQIQYVCYIYDITAINPNTTVSRPKKKEAELIKIRNSLVLQCVESGELNQSDVATIFRLPRNTVSTINKRKHQDVK